MTTVLVFTLVLNMLNYLFSSSFFFSFLCVSQKKPEPLKLRGSLTSKGATSFISLLALFSVF